MATRRATVREAHVGLPGIGATERSDRWWVEPLVTGVALVVLVAYSTYAVFAGDNYRFGPYISPFYSPYFNVPISPAIVVAWIPGLFRVSCYYYRKAYYRSLFLSPPACAVSEPRRTYTGELRPPMSWLPVIHRWALYASIVVLVFLWIDAIRAFDFDGHFGIGGGSLVLLINVILLTGFTMGCHALRSLVGGNVRCFSCAPFGEARRKMWLGVTAVNLRHQFFAWTSLFSVVLADLYVRLCAAGVLVDPRFFLKQ